MDEAVRIGDRLVGTGHPCFFVAEAGTTCNGDLTIAKELADASAEAGFDAIKFQTIDPEQVSDHSQKFRYRNVEGWAEENMYEMFKGLVFNPEQWSDLAQYARSKGLVFFSTEDHLRGVELLESCDVPVHKMGSWDVTFEPLIIKMAATGKPVMLDLGPATLEMIVRFVALVEKYGSGDVILLQDFHTGDPSEMNLRNIPYLKEVFGCPTGFSSPGREPELDITAMALGSDVIEKRITLNRRMPGHHHAVSLEITEIGSWIQRMRYVEASLGSRLVRPSGPDSEDAKKYFRSVCTCKTIKAGDIFATENLDGRRPGTGIPTGRLEEILGRKAARDLPANHLLSWDDVIP